MIGIVLQAQIDGTWSRLKICAADTCRWAFFDSSKNRARPLVFDGDLRQPREEPQLPRAADRYFVKRSAHCCIFVVSG